jgi:CheY-like chemotaxis protein
MPPKPSILVVEDDRDERLALAAWLRRHGYRVDVAGDGREALDALLRSEAPPALILLDLEMPHVDGWRLLAHLALDAQWRSLPVIVTSGTLQGLPRVECPTVAFAPKPLHPESLAELMETLLRGDTWAPEPVEDEPTWPHHVVPGAWRPAERLPTEG